MFQFSRFALPTLCIQVGVTLAGWVSPFGDPRIKARLPAPRGLSQVTTSFIGSWCLGIHRLPLVACCTTKMLASTVKFSTHGRHHPTNQPAGSNGPHRKPAHHR